MKIRFAYFLKSERKGVYGSVLADDFDQAVKIIHAEYPNSEIQSVLRERANASILKTSSITHPSTPDLSGITGKS
jgi:hypothetical protein